MVRRLWMAIFSISATYLLILVTVLALMFFPPDKFALAISKVPDPLVAIVRFRQFWLFARAGSLRVGDPAPEFRLETIDRKERVQLSSFRGQKPVVLVFGSYT